MKKLSLSVLLVAFALPVAAEECTDEMLDERFDVIDSLLEANQNLDLDSYGKAVEEEIGHEPSEAETCLALDMLIEKIEAGA